MKIKIYGISGPCTYEDGGNAKKLYCVGIKADDGLDEFVQWMHDKPLQSKLVDGWMHFESIEERLHTVTVYQVKDGEQLTENEIEELKRYTQGQWSDGIGEGFEQNAITNIDGDEVYLSPWYHGQKVQHKILE
jgi:hypothetical protein